MFINYQRYIYEFILQHECIIKNINFLVQVWIRIRKIIFVMHITFITFIKENTKRIIVLFESN